MKRLSLALLAGLLIGGGVLAANLPPRIVTSGVEFVATSASPSAAGVPSLYVDSGTGSLKFRDAGGSTGSVGGGVSSVAATSPLSSSGGTTPTISIGSAVTAALGGTGQSSYTAGDVLYASGTTALSKLGIGSSGKVLRSSGTAPAWSTTTWPNSATTGDLLYANGSNAYANLADVATGRVLASGGVGTAPAWTQPGGDITGAIGAITVQGVMATPIVGASILNGSLLIGNSDDANWTIAQLTSGSGIDVSNEGGSITITNIGVTSLTSGGGVTVSGSSGSLTLGSSCGGDLSGSVDAATVTKLQGRAVSSSTPSSGQTLRYNGSQWAPWAPTLYTASQHIADYVARGGSAPSLSAGSYTTATAFYFTSDATITGAQFYWPGGGGALVVKVSLYRDTTRLQSTTVSVNAAGVYTATFGASTSVTGTDHNRRYMVALWENSGTKNVAVAVAGFGTPAPPQSFTGYPFQVTPGYIIERFYMDIAGDNPPTSSSANNYYSLVDPLFTMP